MANFQTIFLGVAVVINLWLMFFVLIKNINNPINRAFSAFAGFIALWATSLIFYLSLEDPELALFALKASYIFAILIATTYYIFSKLFPEGKLLSIKERWLLWSPTWIIVALMLVPKFLVKEVVMIDGIKTGILGLAEYVIFAVFFVLVFGSSIVRNWVKWWRAKDLVKKQLLAISTSLTIAGAAGIFFNLILPSPFLENFTYVWLGPLFTSVIVVTIIYSAFQYMAFNVNILVSETLAFALIMFALLNALLPSSVDGPIRRWIFFMGILAISAAMSYHVRRTERLSRIRREFLETASHQLRTPVTLISGLTSMFEEGSIENLGIDKIKEQAKAIRQKSVKLRHIIDDILTATALDTGKESFQINNAIEIDLTKVCQKVYEEHKDEALQKGLKYEFITQETELWIKSDDMWLEQVISNLVDNAVKYTKDGWIKVIVESNLTTAILRVEDSGVGIPETDKLRIYEKFVRGENAQRVYTDGSGLGLFIVKNILSAHKDATIDFESLEGRGTTFTVTFPKIYNTKHLEGEQKYLEKAINRMKTAG